jgi:hypothetical protein
MLSPYWLKHYPKNYSPFPGFHCFLLHQGIGVFAVKPLVTRCKSNAWEKTSPLVRPRFFAYFPEKPPDFLSGTGFIQAYSESKCRNLAK